MQAVMQPASVGAGKSQRCACHRLPQTGNFNGDKQMLIDDIIRLINRHMARLLTDLEDAGCPKLYIQAVKSAFTWLKDDVTKEQ
jgi:hypothetical protein